ncbi:MAG: TonB-dependent receptor [Bacteroidetes bacterium]|nr:TonB-dependent receptor [Bacteroidota bacterium]
MKKYLLLAAIAICMSFMANAQYTISGLIRNDKEPLQGAEVKFQGTFVSTASDHSGRFQIKNVTPGNYTLIVSFIGYETAYRDIRVDKSLDLTLVLQNKAILTEEVEIQSTRAGEKEPFTYQNISFQSLEPNNFGQDMPVLLSNSISTVSTSDAGNGVGYSALRIRGTDMTRINVTINGIPLNDPESHNVFWVDLPDFASSTDNIQVQRGVGTSTNGAAAFGATINLQSSAIKQNPYATLSSSYGSFNTLKNSISFGSGLLKNHWGIDGRMSGISSDGYIDRASSDLKSYFFSGVYCDQKTILRFNLFSGQEKTYQAWNGIPKDILDTNRTYNSMGMYTDASGKVKYYNNETDNYKQTHFQALFSRQLGKSLYLNAAAHYTRGAGYYEEYREDDKLASYGISPVALPGPYYIIAGDTTFVPDSLISTSDLVRQKWLDNDFSGITYSLNLNKGKFKASIGGSMNTYSGRHFGKVIWMQFAGNAENNHEWYRSKTKKQDLNIYTKTNYGINSWMNLFLDLQFRYIKYSIKGIDDDFRIISQDHDFSFFNPKAGAYLIISQSQSAYLSFGIANREPNRDNFVDANPLKATPKPERLYDLEVGHHLSLNNIELNTNLFYMNYHDQLALTGAINDVGAAIMENVPESYRMGVESSLLANFPNEIHLQINATYSINKIRSFTEYVDNWDTWGQEKILHKNTDLAFSPSWIAGGLLKWDFCKNGYISLNSKFVGKQFIDNTSDNGRSLHAYIVHDLGISYSIQTSLFSSVELNFKVNNFLNEKYESNAWVYRYYESDSFHVMDGYFPQAGLNLMAGVNIKF